MQRSDIILQASANIYFKILVLNIVIVIVIIFFLFFWNCFLVIAQRKHSNCLFVDFFMQHWCFVLLLANRTWKVCVDMVWIVNQLSVDVVSLVLFRLNPHGQALFVKMVLFAVLQNNKFPVKFLANRTNLIFKIAL